MSHPSALAFRQRASYPHRKISTDIESRKLRKPIVHGRRLKLVSGITKKVIMVRENKGNADVPVTHSEKMAALGLALALCLGGYALAPSAAMASETTPGK